MSPSYWVKNILLTQGRSKVVKYNTLSLTHSHFFRQNIQTCQNLWYSSTTEDFPKHFERVQSLKKVLRLKQDNKLLFCFEWRNLSHIVIDVSTIYVLKRPSLPWNSIVQGSGAWHSGHCKGKEYLRARNRILPLKVKVCGILQLQGYLWVNDCVR